MSKLRPGKWDHEGFLHTKEHPDLLTGTCTSSPAQVQRCLQPTRQVKRAWSRQLHSPEAVGSTKAPLRRTKRPVAPAESEHRQAIVAKNH